MTFKKSGVLEGISLAKATEELPKPKTLRQRIAVKKVMVAKGEHYYSKSQVGQFTMTNHELKAGDKVIIQGPTTGEQHLVVEQLFCQWATRSHC